MKKTLFDEGGHCDAKRTVPPASRRVAARLRTWLVVACGVLGILATTSAFSMDSDEDGMSDAPALKSWSHGTNARLRAPARAALLVLESRLSKKPSGVPP